MSSLIYLYFEDELKDFINNGLFQAKLLFDLDDADDLVKKRKIALESFIKLSPSDRHIDLMGLIVTKNQLAFDYLKSQIYRNNFLPYILDKGENEDIAEECFAIAMENVYKLVAKKPLNITSTLDNYLFITAKNVWIAYLKEKNNYKESENKEEENDNENEKEHINPFIRKGKFSGIRNFSECIDVIDSDNYEKDDEILVDIIFENENDYEKRIQIIYQKLVGILNSINSKCKQLFEEVYFNENKMDFIAKKLGFSNGHHASVQKSKCMNMVVEKLNALGVSSLRRI